MSPKNLLWTVLIGSVFLATGCVPAYSNGYVYGSSYGTYDSYYGWSSRPYSGSRDPYGYGTYDNRSHGEVHRDLAREHAEEHEKLERKYDKAMNRLDRQEQEAEAKAYRKYGGDTTNPNYQREREKIDQKYDHKREGRKSTRLNSSHLGISYAVFCL